jgi:hypothetical protein
MTVTDTTINAEHAQAELRRQDGLIGGMGLIVSTALLYPARPAYPASQFSVGVVSK